MYAHPSFIRDHAEDLSKLRKLTATSASSRRRCSRGNTTAAAIVKEHNHKVVAGAPAQGGSLSSSSSRSSISHRSVSPSPTRCMMLTTKFDNHAPLGREATPAKSYSNAMRTIMPTYASPKQSAMPWAPIHKVPPSPEMATDAAAATQIRPPGPAVPTATAPVATTQQQKPSYAGRGRLDLLAFAMEQAAAMK